MLTDYIKNRIKEISNKNIAEESCGLIIEKNNNILVFECQNISSNKLNSAILNPVDYIRATMAGKIIAHFHSQPSGQPSYIDYLNAINHNIYSIIYSISEDLFYTIEPKLKEYLDREYKSGESDCYTLVKDYFNKELNIELKDYNRKHEWWKDNPNLIVDNFSKEGGIVVPYNEIQKNDIIVFKIGKIISHLSIYLGNNLILHHPFNNKSVVSEISESLNYRMHLVLRHEKLIKK